MAGEEETQGGELALGEDDRPWLCFVMICIFGWCALGRYGARGGAVVRERSQTGIQSHRVDSGAKGRVLGGKC